MEVVASPLVPTAGCPMLKVLFVCRQTPGSEKQAGGGRLKEAEHDGC